MHRRPLLVALSLTLLAASLGACAESASIPSPPPPAAEVPLFATDEEALEAATVAYTEFLAVLDQLLQGLDNPIGELSDHSTGEALAEAEESVRIFFEEGLRITGPRVLSNVALQRVEAEKAGAEVALYACEDVTGVDLLGPDGLSQVELNRPSVTPFQVVVTFTTEGARVHQREIWGGEGVC
jgi:hypothetical protein